MKRLGSSRRALFLDFGGTLGRTCDNRTVVDTDGMPVLLPYVTETRARVRPAYAACFIASNQRLIGREQIKESEVQWQFACMNERLGWPFTDWRFCPHQRADGCACRKPQPGMFGPRSGV